MGLGKLKAKIFVFHIFEQKAFFEIQLNIFHLC